MRRVVASGAEIEPAAVLDGLTKLIHKSTVIAEREQGQEARYRLLDTVRQYAQEKLAAAGEAEKVRQLHLAYFLQLAEAAEPNLYGGEQGTWLRRLEAEQANLETAMGWALEGDAERREAGLRLASALGWSWDLRARPSQGSHWLERFLSALPEPAPGDRPTYILARAKALAYLSWLLRRAMLNQARNVALAEESVRLCRVIGPAADRVQAFALAMPAWDAFYRSDYAQATRLFREALALSQAAGEKWLHRAMLLGLGDTAIAQGDLARAEALIEESMAIGHEIGDDKGIATGLQSLGEIAVGKGDDHTAEALYHQSFAIAGEVQSRLVSLYALDALGDIALRRGDYEQAGSYYQQSLAGYREMGTGIGPARTLARQGRLAMAQGQVESARPLYRESVALFAEAKDRHEVLLALAGLSQVALERGDAERAWRLLGATEHLCKLIGGLKWPTYRVEYERVVRAIRARLGTGAPPAAWEAGRSMDWEQAIQFGLEMVVGSEPNGR